MDGRFSPYSSYIFCEGHIPSMFHFFFLKNSKHDILPHGKKDHKPKVGISIRENEIKISSIFQMKKLLAILKIYGHEHQ